MSVVLNAATPYNMLQHAATQGNTLQLAASRNNTTYTAKKGVVLNASYVSNTSVSLMFFTVPLSRPEIGSAIS